MTDARLLLTCGMPGAGKTTLARELAATRPAVRLSKDEWLWAIGASPWDPVVNDRVEQQLWRHALDLLAMGVSVVIDFGLWSRAERDAMRLAARDLGVGVELHAPEVPLDELWRRIDARNGSPDWADRPITRADLEAWDRMFEAPDAVERSLFDPPPVTRD